MSTVSENRGAADWLTRPAGSVAAVVGFYLAWTAATWFFEGRVHTLLRPDAVGARLTYALGVNIVLGIGGGALLLRLLLKRGVIELEASGLSAGWVRTPAAVVVGLALGTCLYWVQGAPSWDPIVLANALAQVLVVSIAEVVICWLLVANVARATLDLAGWASTIVAAIAASALFGLYHFAHSPPFDTWVMVGILSVVGLLTSAFYFISRDLWGTVVFHNTLAVYGVVGALAAQDGLGSFNRPMVPLFVTAAVAIGAMVGAQIWLRSHSA